MRLLLILLAICIGGFLYSHFGLWQQRVVSFTPADTQNIIAPVQVGKPRIAFSGKVEMYGLTTCGPCKILAREMTAAGIPYVEYMLDNNQPLQNTLTQRLMKAGIPPGTHSVPILFIGKHVSIGPIPLSTVEAYLQE